MADTKAQKRGTGTRSEGVHQTGKVGGREVPILKESVWHQQQLDPAPQPKNRLGDCLWDPSPRVGYSQAHSSASLCLIPSHQRRWTKSTFGCCYKNEAACAYSELVPCWLVKEVTANTSKHDKENKVQSHRCTPQYWGLGTNMPEHTFLHIREKHKQANTH